MSFRTRPITLVLLLGLSFMLNPFAPSTPLAGADTGEGVWIETEGVALAAGNAPGDYFGSAVSLSADGTVVAVGSPFDGDGTRTGKVTVFAYSLGTWTQQGTPLLGDGADDQFGTAVSLSGSGTRLAVGAIGDDDGGTDAGHVRVFEFSSGAWSQIGPDINGAENSEYFGSAVSLSTDGLRLAVGSPKHGVLDAGQSSIYLWNAGARTWDVMGSPIAGEANDDLSGTSIALDADGDTVAIGAPHNDDGGVRSGHVRVFGWTGVAWAQQGTDIRGEAAGDKAGTSVALSATGTRLVIGAPAHSLGGTAVGAGQARVYSYAAPTWTQVGSDIVGASAGEALGSAVGISGDGARIIVGSPTDDGGGDDAGTVRVFDEVAGAWESRGSSIPGTEVGEEQGSAVALSGDGTTIAIGAPRSDAGGTDSGAVSIYRYRLAVHDSTGAESVVAGAPGIYLHVAGPVGRQVEGSPVYYGSDRVLHASTFLLKLTPVGSGPGQSQSQSTIILASGSVDARGDLESRVVLPAFSPGTYDVVFSARHLGGHGLRLTARIVVGEGGDYRQIAANIPGIFE
jgi:hypothetical protein